MSFNSTFRPLFIKAVKNKCSQNNNFDNFKDLSKTGSELPDREQIQIRKINNFSDWKKVHSVKLYLISANNPDFSKLLANINPP
jgi:hypothetical protein